MRAHGFGHPQVCAQAGREVTVIEVAEEYLNKGLGSLKKQLDKMVEKGKLSADDRDGTIARLRRSPNSTTRPAPTSSSKQ